MTPPPARVRAPALPSRPQAPLSHRAVWTCREGFETHLFEELAWAQAEPRLLGPALVESLANVTLGAPLAGAPRGQVQAQAPSLAFARAGWLTVRSFVPGSPDAHPQGLAAALALAAGERPVHFQAFALDSKLANPLAAEAETQRDALGAHFPSERTLRSAEMARAADGWLAQVCMAGPGLGIVGLVPAATALSLAPGGRQRMRKDGQSPSRAALKLEEALATLPHEPGRGEACVDLGAAPGGWTQRLLERGARVWAVDPAHLRPDLMAHPKLHHVQDSAFRFEPSEPADWLFCDMAWRPLEVAALLAKWGRRRWATQLVANIKLPMKDKNPVLWRVRQVLVQDGGWEHLRMRQLYHDRDEVTVTASRR